MIKRIIFLVLAGLFLVSCGINCKGEPPKRAILNQNIEYGMNYHFVMYEPVGDAGHTPSPKCTKYEYGKSHIYVDDLGRVNGDSVIWIASYQGQTSDMIPSDIKKNAYFVFSKNEITIDGLSGGYEYLNGTWKIETSSPSSWGVPITGN